jgi:Bifunctional DNA primase/polymerase, N-terminal
MSTENNSRTNRTTKYPFERINNRKELYDSVVAATEHNLKFILPLPGFGWIGKNRTKYNGKMSCIKWKTKLLPISGVEINKWYKNDSHDYIRGYALLTGNTIYSDGKKISNDLFAIDIDGQSALEYFNNLLNKDVLTPATFKKFSEAMKVFTGGGNIQILIRYNPEDFPDGIYGFTIKSFGEHEELRIKGNGGYVVGPGSLHSSGKLYTTREWNLEPLTKDEVDEVLGLLHTHVEDTHKKTEYSKSSDEYYGDLITFSENTIHEIISLVRRIYIEGNRQDIIFSLSGIAHRKFVSEQSMINVVESLEKYGINDPELNIRIASIHATFGKSRSMVNSTEYLKNILYARMPYFESIKFVHRYINIIESGAREQGLGHLYSKNRDRELEIERRIHQNTKRVLQICWLRYTSLD